jgi:hypothetical protein
MTLFNKIPSKVSAFILLLSFLGVYFINIGCSIGNITQNLELFSKTETPQHDHGSHDHGDGHHHNSDNNKKSENKEDDGCCNDKTATFFVSVQVVPSSPIDYSFIPTQQSILYAVVNDVSNTIFTTAYFTDNRPPPDILPRFPDTRIFIQSFQI